MLVEVSIRSPCPAAPRGQSWSTGRWRPPASSTRSGQWHSFSYTANNIYTEPPRYLDPHGGGVGGVGAEVAAGVRLVPVGEGHHDVERGQGEHHVEHGPGIRNLDR